MSLSFKESVSVSHTSSATFVEAFMNMPFVLVIGLINTKCQLQKVHDGRLLYALNNSVLWKHGIPR